MLAAGRGVIVDDGVGRFTIDEVVARSGVAKTTIYRWWPSRQSLMLDVIHSLFVPVTTPNTGAVRDDLRTYLEFYGAAPQEATSRLLPDLCSAAQRDPELAELRDTLVAEKRQPVLTILELAQARGEIAQTADLDVLASLIIGTLTYTRSVRGQRVDDALVSQVVDAALAFGACSPAEV